MRRAQVSMMLPSSTLLAILCSLLLMVGCSEQRYPLSLVSGIVTLEGEPLAGARVLFEPRRQGDSPNAGPGSMGRTDETGRYSLTTVDGDQGAVIGPHRVMITTFQQDDQGRIIRKEEVPTHYLSNRSLAFDVAASATDTANFDLVRRNNKR